MIETYYHDKEGYNPFLIREGWQVAQLNHVAKHGLADIDQIEVHRATDEVFILFKGEAVLIAAKPDDKDVHFECVKMKPGVTYNIPAGTWHNIAMDPEVKIIIVEKSDTHKQDCAYLDLTPLQRNRLYAIIEDVLK